MCFQLTRETAPPELPIKDDNHNMHCLLKEYADMFQEPSRLPPTREVDRCITLKEGIEPINVRPYKYAHF